MKICIVGGGSAGWITLSYIAATLDVDITIIHSNEVDPIGVGESTAPTIKHVADTIGVDEQVWMKHAGATFKYGVEFHDFNKIGSRWLHSFDDMIPHQCFHMPLTDNGKTVYERELSSVDYYLKMYGDCSTRFNMTHGPQEHLLHYNLSPYNHNHDQRINQFPGYSYHINASKFGESLKMNTLPGKYTEIIGDVCDLHLVDGTMRSLTLKDGRVVEADIFFDCTGFRRLLIDNLSEWVMYEELINDASIWGTIRNYNPERPVTEAYAKECGWIWSIPTRGQIGTGYVYSASHCSDSEAEDTLIRHWKDKGLDCDILKAVKFNAGRNHDVSIANVISNGLSQSFIEPLEATSVMVTCTTVKSFVELYKRNHGMIDNTIKVHNRVMRKFIEHTRRFVHMHYALSERDDTQYWRDVANKPSAVQDVCDYIDILSTGTWVNKGETLLNQWNWTSMLLGYDKQYTNELPDITSEQMENYQHYTDLLIQNYKHISRNNITMSDYLDQINAI